MPTFLTTSKMDPALAARIEESVRGQKGARRTTARMRRTVALARLVFVLTLGFAIYNLVASRTPPQPAERAPARVQGKAR